MRPDTPKHVRLRRQRRRSKLAQLGYQGYPEYLRSSHWKIVKAKYRSSDLPQECICGEVEVQLHHMTYERVGEERLTDLTPLCHRCHALIHVLEFRGEVGLGFEGFFDEGRAIEGRALLAEFAEQQQRALESRRKDQQEEVLALSFAGRLMRVRDHARFRRRMDITSQLFMLKKRAERASRTDEDLTHRLRQIEELVYRWDGWSDAA